MNAPLQAFRFARRYFLEREDDDSEFSRGESYSQSRFFKKMNVAQHHGPFFDQCAKANAFELMMSITVCLIRGTIRWTSDGWRMRLYRECRGR